MTLPGSPRVELHCHLLGVIEPALLSRIRDQGETILVEPQALQASYPIRDVPSFKHWVEALRPYQSASLDAMRPVLAAHIANLISQNVVYSEIMISPTMFPRALPELMRTFTELREWIGELERGQTQIEFIMVIPRTLSPEILERDTQTFLALHREGLIAGVALVGPENGESVQRFAPAFRSWSEAGMGIEIHAGEHSGPAAIWEALEYCRPNRLGHALSAFDDASLLDEIRRRNVHIEFCPTSNLCTGAVKRIEDHPLGRARDLGLNFSISTDNPGTFQCSMASEFQLAADAFSFTSADFERVFRNSLSSRFEPNLKYLKSLS